METYEEHRNTYARTFELAGNNQLLPELPGFALPFMEQGPRSSGSGSPRTGYIPPVLLKAIAWIEAGWAQADYSVAYGQFGPTLVSHDCGYGLMQVTTGMQNVTGVPSVNQAMIGGHYAFNIARGAQILIDKWNIAPEYRPIVGNRDPSIIENWYYAVWGYNGFSYKNHPANPAYPANRLPYSCGPTNDGLGHNRGQYPYQELVFGCMAHPPVVGGSPLWSPQQVHLATPAYLPGPLSNAAWDNCVYNLQCASMDMPTPEPHYRDGTPLTVTRGQVIGTPVLDLSTRNMNLVAIPPAQQGSGNLVIGNAGSGILSYRIASNTPWLRTSKIQGAALGANLGARNSVVQVSADTTGLGAGRHTGTLTIESPLTANAPATITVVVDNYPQGTLLKGSGPEVFLMWDGLRRYVPNPQTLEANGFTRGIIQVPDSALNSITRGNSLPNALAQGNMFIGSGPQIWVMQGGAKRHVTSQEAMNACGYGADAVRRLSDSTLAGLPTGPALTGAPCPRLTPADGSIVKGSGPAIYTVRGGMKRHIPNGVTFDGMGGRWGNVDYVADSQLNWVKNGNPMLDLQTTGILLRGSGLEVYVMQNGARRHVTSEAVFNGCGYAWEAVYRPSDSSLSGVPLGAPLTDLNCPRFSLNINGRLLRGSGGPEVYVMQGGLKRHIPNSPTFNGRGYSFGNVDAVHATYIGAIITGAPVLDILSDGHLLKGPGPEVYVMQNGTRRHIVSEAVFAACGYSWAAIHGVASYDLPLIPQGAPLAGMPCLALSLPDGALIRGSSGTVYATEAGKKRQIQDASVFGSCSYHWGNVDQIRDAVLNAVVPGPVLTNPPCP